MQKHIFVIFVFVFLGGVTNAQSEKKVAKRGIVKRTVTEINIEDGTGEVIIEEEKWFDAQGNVIELKVYHNDGRLESWEKYTYTQDGDLESETKLNSKGKQLARLAYTYTDGLKHEKLYYDAKDRLVKKKIYAYSYR